MKKLVSVMLACILVLSMANTAFAINSKYYWGEDGVIFDTSHGQIPVKVLKGKMTEAVFYMMPDGCYMLGGGYVGPDGGTALEFNQDGFSGTISAMYRLNGGIEPVARVSSNDGELSGYVKYYLIAPEKRSIVAETGVPNAEVEFLNYRGEVIGTVTADNKGRAEYDPNSYVFDLEMAVAFAEKHWNSGELVPDNDCASFVSAILTQGGYAVDCPYASKNDGEGGDKGQLESWFKKYGGQFIDSSVPWMSVHPGDVVYPSKDHGHAMFVAEVDMEKGVHLYAHSTSAKHLDEGLTNNCWVKMSFYGVAQISHYVYTWRIKDNSKGELVVNKVDEDDPDTKLSGAVFELLTQKEDGSYDIVDAQTTGTDGKVYFNELDPGEYVIREKTPPTGYLLNEDSGNEDEVN